MDQTGRLSVVEEEARKEVRWSARRKADAVMRLPRGEDLDEVSRELRVEAHRLAARGGKPLELEDARRLVVAQSPEAIGVQLLCHRSSPACGCILCTLSWYDDRETRISTWWDQPSVHSSARGAASLLCCPRAGHGADLRATAVRGQGQDRSGSHRAGSRPTTPEPNRQRRVAAVCADLKALSDYRDQLVRSRTQVANRVHRDLAILRPGYQRRVANLTAKRNLVRAASILKGDRSVRADLIRRRLAELRRLDAEAARTKAEIVATLEQSGTTLTEVPGMGPLLAARILGEVGDPRRIRSKAAFAQMAGTAPLPASSGATTRHRLNRGGNRKLNHALHYMALVRYRFDPDTRAYVQRRRQEGSRSGGHAVPHWSSIGGRSPRGWPCSSVSVGGRPRCRAASTASLSSAAPDAPRPSDRR